MFLGHRLKSVVQALATEDDTAIRVFGIVVGEGTVGESAVDCVPCCVRFGGAFAIRPQIVLFQVGAFRASRKTGAGFDHSITACPFE